MPHACFVLHSTHLCIHKGIISLFASVLISYVILCKGGSGSLDYIIDTVSASHPIEPLLGLLKIDGKMVLVGIPQLPLQIHPGPLIFGDLIFAFKYDQNIIVLNQIN